jgi:hypothetical protein
VKPKMTLDGSPAKSRISREEAPAFSRSWRIEAG